MKWVLHNLGPWGGLKITPDQAKNLTDLFFVFLTVHCKFQTHFGSKSRQAGELWISEEFGGSLLYCIKSHIQIFVWFQAQNELFSHLTQTPKLIASWLSSTADVSSAVCCRGERGGARVRPGSSSHSHCSKSPPEVQTRNKKCHCVAPHQHWASVLTDIVFAFPLLCVCRMIIVWHIQYVNIIIVRGTGAVIMGQEMTCRDPWWPQRESCDPSLTLSVYPGLWVGLRQVGCSVRGEKWANNGLEIPSEVPVYKKRALVIM